VDARGFCYVASTDGYLDEAIKSIASLREQVPDASVTVITQRDLFRPEEPVDHWLELRQPPIGPIVKTDVRFAPYDRTVFLDTDTLIIGDPSPLFELLDRVDFVFANEPNARADYGLSRGIPAVFPEPNSGVFAFRKSEQVEALFATWLDEYEQLHGEFGLVNDQVSLRIALWRCQSVRQLMVGSEYNLIPHTNPGVSGEVVIIHDRSPDRFMLAETINRHVEPRAIVSGFGAVFGFVSRRGWAKQCVRLAWKGARAFVSPASFQQRGHPQIWWRNGVD
jgi:hypothetical protein